MPQRIIEVHIVDPVEGTNHTFTIPIGKATPRVRQYKHTAPKWMRTMERGVSKFLRHRQF